MKTYMPSATTVEKKWYVVDATDTSPAILLTLIQVIM